MSGFIFPALGDWQETKSTLHAYSKVVAAVPRKWAAPHPKWWHVSLRVSDEGLSTDSVALPGGDLLHLRMDLNEHRIALETGRDDTFSFDMTAGLTANELAHEIFSVVAKLGLAGDYDTAKYENDEPRSYDREQAERFFDVVRHIDGIFKKHIATLPGEPGQVQLWPHGFDIAVEWFGTRVVVYDEGGETVEYPSQLNLGWTPGEPGHPAPYFYSNPWPFEESLLGEELPEGARWFTESWKGTIMPYAGLVGDPQAGDRLLGYARRVFEVARPTLTA